MVGILGADNHYLAVTLDNLALVTHGLNRCSYFHNKTPLILVSVGDSSLGYVVRGHFNLNRVAFQNLNVVHSDFSGNGAGYDMSVNEFNLEHCVA